ncbi:10739_t:CDS:2 [Diversispora eburnea]|uniref:10739_t:CDS:1 n=1 Tax=Diversispora eburnea TaxID=1213867 RepID=A0A9N8ZG14_9GLOM|nr:10739_t:CDS:2 [Diversispora eburnea]
MFGNNGNNVGFAIAQRLLYHSSQNPLDKYRIILGCRNEVKATKARKELLKEYPNGLIDIVMVDVNLLFCNAGILSCVYVDWWVIPYQLISNPKELFTDTKLIVQPVGNLTEEGLGETFACNIFGHYVMVSLFYFNWLIDNSNMLAAAAGHARIVWTSSCTAKRDDYNPIDYQCIKGSSPYESSKYISDIISIALNSRLNQRGIFSFTTHPGVVASNIVRDHLGIVMGKAMEIGLHLARILGLKEETITAWNGSYSNYIVATQPIENLNKYHKYGSYVKPWGSVYYLDELIDRYNENEALKRVLYRQ